jgi:hypothetical protein
MLRSPIIWKLLFFVLLFGQAGKATELIKVLAKPASGFNFPYYLYIPNVLKEPKVLMVETNNSLTISDDQAFHDDAARNLILTINNWAADLGCPWLVPTFPRPASYPFVNIQSLNREAIMTDLAGLVRVDLQLLAMIADARALLATKGHNVDPKVWMIGYSSSGSFANRFTLLHPEAVKAASIGSPGSYPMSPVSLWKASSLRYPVGIADIEAISGKKFDAATFKTIPLQIYIGDNDGEDTLNYQDSYDTEDADLIKEVFGGPPAFMRWPGVEAAYNSVQSSSQFVIFPGMTHQWPDWAYVRDFFERNRKEPFPAPLPKPQPYKLYFPHVASGGGWETEVALTNPLKVSVQGQLQAFTAAGQGPLESVPVSLPALGRKQVTVGKSFASAKDIAYLVFTSDSGFTTGYTRFNQPGNRVSLPTTGGIKQGWFPKMEKNGWTGLAFINIDNSPANIIITAADNNGNKVAEERIVVGPRVKTVGMVDELFHGDLKNARYFQFVSDQRLVAFTVNGSADGLMLDGLAVLGRYVR